MRHSLAEPLSEQLVANVRKLERILKRDVWLLIQPGWSNTANQPYESLDIFTAELFRRNKAAIGSNPISVLLDSPGGQAREAYRICSALRQQCGSFDVIVPRFAKSAATLLALGADRIILGDDGELGPLDVQVFDPDDEEKWVSGLDEVQAVERLHQCTVEAAAASLLLMQKATDKRLNRLMPDVFRLIAESTKPLFDKIDAVRYTRMSRLLDVAEQYAVKLLQPQFSEAQAKSIAHDLVTRYPSHDFILDRAECLKIGKDTDGSPIGLQVVKKSDELFKKPELATILSGLNRSLWSFPTSVIGRITEIKK